MLQHLDPAIRDASLEQLEKSLAKYNRANQKQRGKLGGPGACHSFSGKGWPLKCVLYVAYKAQLEKNILDLRNGAKKNVTLPFLACQLTVFLFVFCFLLLLSFSAAHDQSMEEEPSGNLSSDSVC